MRIQALVAAVLAVLALPASVGAFVEPRISDECFITPELTIRQMYDHILPRPPSDPISWMANLKYGTMYKSSKDKMYTTEFMQLQGRVAAVMTWSRPEGLIRYVDFELDGVFEDVRVGNRPVHIDFQAKNHGCHVLEMVLQGLNRWLWYEFE